MKKLLFLFSILFSFCGLSFGMSNLHYYNVEMSPEDNCKYIKYLKNSELSYEECVEKGKAIRKEYEEWAKQKKQEEYLNSPEYKQKLLEEKQKELEAKQAELEKKQKELEMKSEAMEVKVKSFPEVELAKSALGSKASIIESLVPIIKSKDEATQKKVSLILETFKASSDEYTRNVGIYLSCLLK